MPKPHLSSLDLDQHGRNCWRQCVKSHYFAKQHFARVQRLAEGFAVILGGDEEQRASCRGKAGDPAKEGALQAIGQRQPLRLGGFRPALAARQLDQGQGIACRLVEETMAQIRREARRLDVEQAFCRCRAEP
jgi:hypothetical protein